MPTEPQLRKSREVLLQTLQSRLNIHGSRLWQLPFTYIGFASVSISILLRGDLRADAIDIAMFLLALGLLGVFVENCMRGSREGYERTVRDINEVSRELGVKEYAQSPTSHILPYFRLMMASIIMILILATIFGFRWAVA